MDLAKWGLVDHSSQFKQNRIIMFSCFKGLKFSKNISLVIVVFFSSKDTKRYERADRKHEIYLMRPKGKTQILRHVRARRRCPTPGVL